MGQLEFLLFVVALAVCGLIGMKLAQAKGYDPIKGFIWGAVGSFVTFLVFAFLPSRIKAKINN